MTNKRIRRIFVVVRQTTMAVCLCSALSLGLLAPTKAFGDITITCGPDGTQFNEEPQGGNTKFLGVTQPMDKLPTAIDFLPGAGAFSSDFIIATFFDQVGPFGGNGGSNSGVTWHSSNKVSGKPDCSPSGQAGLAKIVDSNGITLVGFASSGVLADTSNNEINLFDIHEGCNATQCDNALGLEVTNPVTLESSACAGAAAGEAKNEACFPTRFAIATTSFNITEGTGTEWLQVAGALDTTNHQVWLAMLGKTSSGTVVDAAVCKEPVTGSSNCTPLGLVLITTPSNPIVSFNMGILPSAEALLVVDEGSASSQTLNVGTCTVTVPSSPTCSSFTTLFSFTPVEQVQGQQFNVASPPGLAVSGSNVLVVLDSCKVSPFTTPFITNECATPKLEAYASSNKGSTFAPYTLATETGQQYFPSATYDGIGNVLLSHLSTGKDSTGESLSTDAITIPSNLASGLAYTLAPPTYPSGGFSSGGKNWGAPVASPIRGGSLYVQLASTLHTGKYSGTVKLKETNVVLKLTISKFP